MKRLIAVLVVVGMASAMAIALSASAPVATQTEIVLPAPVTKGTMSLEEALAKRRSIRGFESKALTQQQVGQLLWAAQGITDPATGHRTAPSAMARYPMTVWMFDATGVYKYQPKGHLLIKISDQDRRAEVTQPARGGSAAPVTFILTGDPSVFGGRGADMAQKFIYLEGGHIAQNLALEATALGLATVTQGGINAAKIAAAVSLPEGAVAVYALPVGYAAR